MPFGLLSDRRQTLGFRSLGMYNMAADLHSYGPFWFRGAMIVPTLALE